MVSGPDAGVDRCEHCGGAGPLRNVRFHKHVGLIVLFWHSRAGGRFCRPCVGQAFTGAFWLTAVLGWWGVVSFFITLFVLPYDLVHYLLTVRSFSRDQDVGGRVGWSLASGLGCMLASFLALPLSLVLAMGFAFGGGESLEQLARVCAGAPVIDAPARDGSRRAVAFQRVGDRWEPSQDFIPEPWRADPDDASIVVCVEPEREEVEETCPLGDGRAIWRTRYPRPFRAVEARTATELASGAASSTESPPPCDPASAPASSSLVRRSAPRAQPEDVQRELERLPIL